MLKCINANEYFTHGGVLQTLPIIYTSEYSEVYILRHDRIVPATIDYMDYIVNYKPHKHIIAMRYFGYWVPCGHDELLLVLCDDLHKYKYPARGIHIPEVSFFQNDVMYDYDCTGKIRINPRPIVYAYLQNISIKYAKYLI